MARSRRMAVALLLVSGLVAAAQPDPASAGPLVRRAQERKACQEFASKLQQASGNPSMAQQVYQQGVLQLVSRFGENPCGDIPAPNAAGAAAATTTAPATAAPGAPGAPGAAKPAAAPAATGKGASGSAAAPATTNPSPKPATPSSGQPAAAPSAQQQQACQQFASKLQAAAASGGAAAAQQTYSMGLQKLSGMFGPNPCPAIQPPR